MERVRALAHGRVQGVNFRGFVSREARRLGLTGYARNLPDGDVEVVAEGPRVALEALLLAVGRGPALSRVDGVGESWHAATGEFDSWEVRW